MDLDKKYISVLEEHRKVSDSLLDSYRSAYSLQGALIASYQKVFRDLAKSCETENDVLVAQKLREMLKKMGYLKEEE